MDRHAVRLEQRHEFFGGNRFRVAQLLEPLLTRLTLVVLDAARRRLQHRAQDRARDRRPIPELMSRFLPTVR